MERALALSPMNSAESSTGHSKEPSAQGHSKQGSGQTDASFSDEEIEMDVS